MNFPRRLPDGFSQFSSSGSDESRTTGRVLREITTGNGDKEASVSA